jgi:hypothetical protein
LLAKRRASRLSRSEIRAKWGISGRPPREARPCGSRRPAGAPLIDGHLDAARAGVGTAVFAAEQALGHLGHLAAGIAVIGIDAGGGACAHEGRRESDQRQTAFERGQHQRLDGDGIVEVRIRETDYEIDFALEGGESLEQVGGLVAIDYDGEEAFLAGAGLQRIGGIAREGRIADDAGARAPGPEGAHGAELGGE